MERNGLTGQGWLTLTALATGPTAGKTFSTAPTPSAVQYGLAPLTPSNSPTAFDRAQTWVSSDGLPGLSTTSSGPRFLAEVDSGS